LVFDVGHSKHFLQSFGHGASLPLGEIKKMGGAMSFGLLSLTQEASQKSSFFPFPIEAFVASAKISPS
jgi:hypothetical protein